MGWVVGRVRAFNEIVHYDNKKIKRIRGMLRHKYLSAIITKRRFDVHCTLKIMY